MLAEESMRLQRWLQNLQEIRSVSILGGQLEEIARIASRALPSAALRVIVANARDFEKLGSMRELSGAKIIVGTDFTGNDQTDELLILHVVGFEGKEPLRMKITSAWRRLADGGTLAVLTQIRRGAKSQLAQMEHLFGSVAVESCGGGRRLLVARAQKSPAGSTSPGADTVTEPGRLFAEMLGERFEFYTSSAVFSKDRIDHGTRILIEALPPECTGSVLDIGCGYGVIGITVARLHPRSRVTLVDIDAHAVELAASNVKLNHVEANTRVVLSDGLRQIPGERFNLAAIHFPLHIPREELERLLTEIHDALVPGGCLYGVLLGTYELRPLVHSVFGEAETLLETRKEETASVYRIIRACRR